MRPEVEAGRPPGTLALALLASILTALPAAPGQAQVPMPAVPPPAALDTAPTATGPRLSLSLADAVFVGLRDNRELKSAYLSRAAQKYGLFVAKTRFLPRGSIDAQADWSRTGGIESSSTLISPGGSWLVPTGAQFQFGWSRVEFKDQGPSRGSDTTTLSVIQPLLRGGGVAVNTAPLKQALLQEQINRLQLRAAVSNTLAGIVLAYRSLLQAQEQLVIARQSLERSQDQLRTNQALIDAGRMAASEIVQTQADIANQQVSLLAAEQQKSTAQLTLLALLAMDLHTDVVAVDEPDPRRQVVDVDQAIALALDNRPDYQSQKRNLEQAKLNLVVARNAQLWDLSVNASLQHQTQRGGGGVIIDPVTGAPVPVSNLPGGVDSRVGVRLSIPLGDFSIRQQEIQATTTVRLQENQLDDQRQRIEAEVRDAVQGVELAWRRLETARQARDLAARSLDIARQKLQVGRTSNFEVVSFETALRSAETQALSAQISYLNTLTSLDLRLGTTLDTWKIALQD